MHERKKRQVYLFSSFAIFLALLAAYVLIGLFYPFELDSFRSRFVSFAFLIMLFLAVGLSLLIEQRLWGKSWQRTGGLRWRLLLLLALYVVASFVAEFFFEQMLALLMSVFSLTRTQAVDVGFDLACFVLVPLILLLVWSLDCRARLRYHRGCAVEEERQVAANLDSQLNV